jgi:putative endonuclease
MFYVYVIISERTGKYYKGMTENLSLRLKDHNRGGTTSTKSGGPWYLGYYERFQSRAEARVREKYLKSAAGRRFLAKAALGDKLDFPEK